MKNIFKPYFTSDKVQGNGIGLYYAQSIVRAHGGNISVTSSAGKPHIFNNFTQYIEMKKSKIKVLLVDDDVLLGNSVMQELNKRNYEATYLSATYGVADAIKQLAPDVLVFDVEMGRENGIEMTKELFKGNPTLPIIFISSHHGDEMKKPGFTPGD